MQAAAGNTHLIAFQNWTLRVREPRRTPARLLLMLHGWTGDENSMWIFARNFPDDYRILAPRGPHAAAEGGYSWRALRSNSFGRPSLDDLRDSAEALVRLVDAYAAQSQVDTSRFDAVGFSQGAALVNVLSLLHPQRVRKMGILAGFMPLGAEGLVATKPLAGKPAFVAHGTQDNLVPIDRARVSKSLLEQAGAQITYCEAKVGHKVSADCLRELEAFLAE